jgi:hypothetical protein
MFLTPEKFNTLLNIALVKSTFLEKLGGVVVVLLEEPVVVIVAVMVSKSNGRKKIGAINLF